jgi:hypothetical protein
MAKRARTRDPSGRQGAGQGGSLVFVPLPRHATSELLRAGRRPRPVAEPASPPRAPAPAIEPSALRPAQGPRPPAGPRELPSQPQPVGPPLERHRRPASQRERLQAELNPAQTSAPRRVSSRTPPRPTQGSRGGISMRSLQLTLGGLGASARAPRARRRKFRTSSSSEGRSHERELLRRRQPFRQLERGDP